MPETTEFFIDELPTPIGQLQIISDNGGAIRLVGWYEGKKRYYDTLKRWYGDIEIAPKKNAFDHTKAMRAYFNGDVHAIDDLLTASAGTDFQKKVWKTLRRIPAGETWSYGQMAQHLGQPTATRAVGLANGSNPIGIVVPCHRVIGANGMLTGYGGGLLRKKWLLAHEAKHAPIGLFGKAS